MPEVTSTPWSTRPNWRPVLAANGAALTWSCILVSRAVAEWSNARSRATRASTASLRAPSWTACLRASSWSERRGAEVARRRNGRSERASFRACARAATSRVFAVATWALAESSRVCSWSTEKSPAPPPLLYWAASPSTSFTYQPAWL